jgi:hypothetical protein
MPIESDNDAERESRITDILRKIRESQERVERLAAEGRRRAEEIATGRQQHKERSSASKRQQPK